MPPRSTLNSQRRQYQTDRIEGQQGHIDQSGPIDCHAGNAHIAPSNINAPAHIDRNEPIDGHAGIAHIAPSNINQTGEQMTHESERATNAPSHQITNEPERAINAPGQRDADYVAHDAHQDAHDAHQDAHASPRDVIPNPQRDTTRTDTTQPEVPVAHRIPQHHLLAPTLPRTDSSGIGRSLLDPNSLIDDLHVSPISPGQRVPTLSFNDAFETRHGNPVQMNSR
jgi:hypothetical protein